MYEKDIFVRFTRIDGYFHVLLLIFPLIFLISPMNLFSYKTVIIFFANLFLTAFGYVINDVEDAEDDYHDIEKRKRNPISNGEVTKNQSYALSLFLMSVGLILLTFINISVFLFGLLLAIVGFLYSWKTVRLKSVPILDLISHVIYLGGLQFLITYLTFRPFDLFVIPFLMVIIPFSVINEILQQYKDFEVDRKTNVNTTVQKFDSSYITKLLATLVLIVIVGLSIIIFSIPLQFKIMNLIISLITGVLVIYRVSTRASNVMQM